MESPLSNGTGHELRQLHSLQQPIT